MSKQKRVFEFIDQEEDFRELEVEDTLPLQNLLNSDSILAFIDSKGKIVWIWIGKNSTPKMRFTASYMSKDIKMLYAFGHKIISVDEDDETIQFKIFIGLEKEPQQGKQDIGPKYRGTIENEKELELIKREEVLQILEKIELPEGYRRKMVIVKDIIYSYMEKLKHYHGTNVRERDLIPLKKKVEDGTYLMDSYVSRVLISFNKVVLIEILQKVGSI